MGMEEQKEQVEDGAHREVQTEESAPELHRPKPKEMWMLVKSLLSPWTGSLKAAKSQAKVMYVYDAQTQTNLFC